MAIVEMEAGLRPVKSKGYLNELRAQGFVPGVVYGKDIGSVGIKFRGKELDGIMRRHGRNTLIALRIGSNGEQGERHTVMVKEMQHHPLKNMLLHVDFHQISLEDEITTVVGLALTGEAPGVSEGGVVSHTLRQLEVSCLATAIPDVIEVDISGLEIGEGIHVSDLAIPEGVRVLSDPETLVVNVLLPRIEEEEEEEEEEEVDEAEVAVEDGESPVHEEGEEEK